MKKSSRSLILVFGSFLLASCQPERKAASETKITSVSHTSVKRQSIGNCWLYAQATWLESMLKSTEGRDINVSESYWTYWDLYHKLLENEPIPEEELNTGGSWNRSKQIIERYGWVEEKDFLPDEDSLQMSAAQACATKYILAQGKEGGTLFDPAQRTPELIRAELNKGFSCEGRYAIDMEAAQDKKRTAEETMLKNVKTGEEKPLSEWLVAWQQVTAPAGDSFANREGKKLPSLAVEDAFSALEERLKRALNDHQPVILSWYVSFNAPDEQGLFNLNTLAAKAEVGQTGGHMVVLHDYTVDRVPELGFMGEGDLSDEDKIRALTGQIRYVVSKNSWGSDRPDRPWLADGYTRISWDYLKGRYWDEDAERFRAFFWGFVFPPGY